MVMEARLHARMNTTTEWEKTVLDLSMYLSMYLAQ